MGKVLDSDPLPLLWNIALVLGLVLLNGFFVAAEFAMVKVRSSRIDTLAEEGRTNAKFAKGIIHNLDAYLSACQLGITLTSLGLGYVGEPAFALMLGPLLQPFGLSDGVFHTISFLIAFTLMTTLHITLGEQFPKTYAIRKAEKITLLSAAPMVLFYKIMFPFIWVLNGISNWMLRRVGIEPTTEHEIAHTEEEIRVLMKESHKNGLIDNTELTLVDNIFEFADTTAKEIMIPRTEMECLYANLSYAENLAFAIKDMRTRYPVCDPDKDNIIGFVHIKDLLKPDSNLKGIKKIMRPLMTVPDSIQISDLLKILQKKRGQMALLIDEYGGTSGLVTLEDIMEEIVGEIQDEFDEERPTIEMKDENTFSIDGLLLIDEVNNYFGLEITSDDYDTIGGWVYSQIEMPPSKNQQVMYNEEFQFVVEETDHLRISRIMVRKLVVQEDMLEQNIS
ncbi:hemolysin family protein [Paenibacillus eucommiae]|uniref:CBS domain containing-hemolysin-like protein n=1 Tax=Paenibacillus eucommiae TaxID=1355755 RepID=A0ABS4IZ03_9BACL|nr:hemolysin family protein [Paenibacillus eucommiae]MBP1992829.1 CBS domain containing-hemolysin-like protein [Paenibacillus eucommiae]